MSEQLAIIKDIGIGCRDTNWPVLWFTVYVSEVQAALTVLSWDDAYEVLKHVREVRDLEGKPCWVDVDGNMIKFLRLWSTS